MTFLPYYCHSFQIIVISNTYLSSLIAPIPSHTRRARKLAGLPAIFVSVGKFWTQFSLPFTSLEGNKKCLWDFPTFSTWLIKVSKFQKQILLFLFEWKHKRNYFLNFALASKMSQIKKWRHFIILIRGYLIQCNRDIIFFYLTHFRSFGQKSKHIIVQFLVQMRTRKFVRHEVLSSKFQ